MTWHLFAYLGQGPISRRKNVGHFIHLFILTVILLGPPQADLRKRYADFQEKLKNAKRVRHLLRVLAAWMSFYLLYLIKETTPSLPLDILYYAGTFLAVKNLLPHWIQWFFETEKYSPVFASPDGTTLGASKNSLSAIPVSSPSLTSTPIVVLKKNLPPNAFVTGGNFLLKSHTIFLTSALVEQLTPEETTAVIAHEQAHLHQFSWIRGTLILLGVFASCLLFPVAFYGVIRTTDSHSPLYFLLCCLSSAFLLVPVYLGQFLYRWKEFDADRKAVHTHGVPVETLIRALQKFKKIAPPLQQKRAAFCLHPQLDERISALRNLPTRTHRNALRLSHPQIAIYSAMFLFFIWIF